MFRRLRNWRLSVVRLWGKTQHIDMTANEITLQKVTVIKQRKDSARQANGVSITCCYVWHENILRIPLWGIRIIKTAVLCLTDTYLGTNYDQNSATAQKRNVIAMSDIHPNDNVTPVSWYLCQPLSCRLKWALKCFVHIVSATIRSGGTLAKVATGKKRTSS